jgi:hypothetical protein
VILPISTRLIRNGFVIFNRRYLYAVIHWAMENHSQLIDTMRDRAAASFSSPPASTCWRILSCATCLRRSGPPANSPLPIA